MTTDEYFIRAKLPPDADTSEVADAIDDHLGGIWGGVDADDLVGNAEALSAGAIDSTAWRIDDFVADLRNPKPDDPGELARLRELLGLAEPADIEGVYEVLIQHLLDGRLDDPDVVSAMELARTEQLSSASGRRDVRLLVAALSSLNDAEMADALHILASDNRGSFLTFAYVAGRVIAENGGTPSDDDLDAFFKKPEPTPEPDPNEALHSRAHATYFGRSEEMGVKPFTEVSSYDHPETDESGRSTAFGARIYKDNDTGTVLLFWTDFVANDWIDVVPTMEWAFRRLSDLIIAVDSDELLPPLPPEAWEGAPPPTGLDVKAEEFQTLKDSGWADRHADEKDDEIYEGHAAYRAGWDAANEKLGGRPMDLPPCPSCGALDWKVDCDIRNRAAVAIDHDRRIVHIDRCGPVDSGIVTVGSIECQACAFMIDESRLDTGVYDRVVAAARATIEDNSDTPTGDVTWRILNDYREF